MTIKLIYLFSFMDLFSMALLMPLNARHILSLGGTRFIIGVIASIHSLFQLISGPLVGSWGDTNGRKPLLQATYVFATLCYFLLSFDSLYVVIFSKLIYAITYHVGIQLKALIADNSKPEDQAAIFGKMGALGGLSFIVGPILGGHLVGNGEGLYSVCMILCTSSFLCLVLTAFLPNTKPQQVNSEKKQGIISNLKSIDWAVFWDIFALKLLVEAACSMYFQTFGLIFMEVFETTQKELGYIISVSSLVAIFINLTIGSVKEKLYKNDFNFKRRNMHAIGGMAIFFAIMALVQHFWLYVFFLVVPFSIFKTLFDSSLMESLLSRTKEDGKGTVMGAFESTIQMAGLVTPILSGSINEFFGYSATIGTCVVPLVMALVLVSMTTKKVKV